MTVLFSLKCVVLWSIHTEEEGSNTIKSTFIRGPSVKSPLWASDWILTRFKGTLCNPCGGEQATKGLIINPGDCEGRYLQVCVWEWLAQTGKILAGLSSSLCVSWGPMTNQVRSPGSPPDWAFPPSLVHVCSFSRDVDCVWSPGKHEQTSSWQQITPSSRTGKRN